MHPTASIADVRFMEFEVFEVKPGHEAEWDAAVKLVKDAYAKGIPDASWDMFQAVYGRTTSYVVITPLKSLSEVDRNFMASQKFVEAMGADGMKKLRRTLGDGSCVDRNEFVFDQSAYELCVG